VTNWHWGKIVVVWVSWMVFWPLLAVVNPDLLDGFMGIFLLGGCVALVDGTWDWLKDREKEAPAKNWYWGKIVVVWVIWIWFWPLMAFRYGINPDSEVFAFFSLGSVVIIFVTWVWIDVQEKELREIEAREKEILEKNANDTRPS